MQFLLYFIGFLLGYFLSFSLLNFLIKQNRELVLLRQENADLKASLNVKQQLIFTLRDERDYALSVLDDYSIDTDSCPQTEIS